jgi:hypothetical protein
MMMQAMRVLFLAGLTAAVVFLGCLGWMSRADD